MSHAAPRLTTPCPICGEKLLRTTHDQTRSAESFDELYECDRCGAFTFEQGKKLPRSLDSYRHLVSAFVYRENRRKNRPAFFAKDFTASGWIERFQRMGFPETVAEKTDASLVELERRAPIGSDTTPKDAMQESNFVSAVAARNMRELNDLWRLLLDREFVEPRSGRITAKGYEHLEKITRSPRHSDSAFVALWYDDTTADCRLAIASAIEHCGYSAIIMNQIQFSDFIMNQIIASIRRSRFLVADFTALPESDDQRHPKVRGGSRGGVYWEAGMAYGLGLPVLHTCRDDTDSRRRTHFDIDQYNTMFWTDGEDLIPGIRPGTPDNPRLAERLAALILAEVGQGPIQPRVPGVVV